ncbi:hypothetical protein PV379_11515 [Streptomyces caniscabiei]|uniref:hypothetical protein n=1 Tax=Streptomyces caniscabiei TaxID=2746961 RepID=UPI0029A9DDC9|nr:hypothetical protein [Streptomyces caniscabiei]MDX2600630.1 hypothetical protein [Streptomyces caniscabiei]MDX2736789.1 hypothetical protein [Streptomyces caniscabiei]MDX2777936.1 hypothetical protein [Streptomyces caniscabiei]
MNRTREALAVTALTACVLVGSGVGPAAAAGDPLLPHPGPEGLVWVEEQTGDGGVASGGAWDKLPTVLTVACEGGGEVRVTMRSQETEVAAFSVDCPAGTAGIGAVTMDAGVVRMGSFTVGVDASSETIRWALTVTQPE